MVLFGATLLGIDARLVEIDVRLLRGQMGRFLLTGLPGAAVKESRERVRAAVAAAGFEFPARSLLVHLAPGDLRKEGPLLDLPIAIGVLAAVGAIEPLRERRIAAAGELALDGTLRPVRGAVAIALAARRAGCEALLLPPASAASAALVPGLAVLRARDIAGVAAFLEGRIELERAEPPAIADADRVEDPFADVRAQETAKRALAVAAAGRHNVLLVGPPGAGKTMLARRLPDLLPPLLDEDVLEVERIHGVAGLASRPPTRRPPFRAPHHTASPSALVGGGPQMRPGEVSLAHRGVLFLDEFPEFPRHAIEALRQPLEDRRVCVARAAGTFSFPADIVLVAAMNPCPCGLRGDRRRACRCSEARVQKYVSRISGPVLDRIDLVCEVPAVAIDDLLSPAEPPEVASWRTRVDRAVRRQRTRLRGSQWRWNGELEASELDHSAGETEEARALLRRAGERLSLSARALVRVRRVARTAADLEDRDRVTREDVAFALSCRVDPAQLAAAG